MRGADRGGEQRGTVQAPIPITTGWERAQSERRPAAILCNKPRFRRAGQAALVIGAAITGLAALLQWSWAGWSVYAGPGPSLAMRWLLTEAVGAALLLPVGAAVAGAAVGRRIADSGLRDQVRITGRGAALLAMQAARWALLPPLLAVSASAGGWVWVAALGRGESGLPRPMAIGMAHALAGVLVAAFGLWGLALAVSSAASSPAGERARSRRIPVTLARSGMWAPLLLAALVPGPAWVGPLLLHLARPERLLDAVLLVNPVTAIGAVLGMDVLRSPRIYALTRAPEYWYSYPPAAGVAAVYIAVAALGATCLWRRLARE